VIRGPSFVGRERELSALGEALAAPSTVVLVEGEAGIGKTRLLREFFATPVGRASKTVTACCPPFRYPQTLGPVVEGIRQCAGPGVAGLGSSALAGALRPLFPEWAEDLPPALEPLEDAPAARNRVFRALAELFARLRVGLLVTEDAHWADEATLEFLLYLASREPRPVALLVTFRPEDVPGDSLLPRLARHAAGASGLRMSLAPLAMADTTRLAVSMLDAQPMSDEFAGFLHRASGGVPLAVEELVRLMAERPDLAWRGGAWTRRPLDRIEVPASIRDAALERARRLSADAQAVLRIAAVLGEPTSEATVGALTMLPAGRDRAGLCEALDCGLVAEDELGLVSFRHLLPGRAVYEAIPVPDRRAIHLAVASLLEHEAPVHAARLAHHFREAGERDQWYKYGEQAADLALASGDEASAVDLLHDLIVHGRLSARAIARLTKKIPLTSVTGDARFQSLISVLRSALAEQELDRALQAELRLLLGRVLTAMHDFDAARTELEQAVAHLPHGSVDATKAMLLLGVATGASCSAATHRRWLRRAAASADRMSATDRLPFTVDLATGLLGLGDEAGWQEVARIPAHAPDSRQTREIIRAGLNIGELAMVWGRYQEAGRRLAKAISLAERGDNQRIRAELLVNQARLDWFTGQWGGLAERAAVLAASEHLMPASRLEACLVSNLICVAAGPPEASEPLLDALEATLRRGAISYHAEVAAAVADQWLARGRIDEALRVSEQVLGIIARKRMWIWATGLVPARVRALLTAAKPGEAAHLVAAFDRGLRGTNAAAPKAGLSLCRAILAEDRGDRARAAALFARTAAAWEALPRPYDALLANEQQARCLLAAERRGQAVPLLKEVMRGLSRLGATGDASRVARTLRENGVRTRRPGAGRPAYRGALSSRERDVVRLVATGQTDREIATALFLSPKTIASHVGSAMRKLQATSRTALAVRAVEAGIITEPSATSVANLTASGRHPSADESS
jgi:DNA-binding CsgD family transcriptional regulator